MKQRLQGMVAGVLMTVLLLGAITVYATNTRTLEATFGVRVNINGELQTFADDMQPFTADGRTWLPVRGIADALGLDVDWDGTTQTVYLTSGTTATTATPAAPDVITFGGVVVENERTRITFHGTETNRQGQGVLVFLAENRTDRVLTFQSNAMSVDGVGIGSVMGSSSVAPQSSGFIRFTGRDPLVTMTPSTITGNIRIIDMDSQPREDRWDTITVEFQNVNVRQ